VTPSSGPPQGDARHARALLELGRDDEAATLLKRLIADDPSNAEAMALLSRTYRESDPARGYKLATAALALDPTSTWLHLNAAWAADFAKRRDDAARHARAVISDAPSWAAGYQALAQILCQKRRDVDEAKRIAAKAVALDPHDPASWIASGNAALADRDADAARLSYLRALAIDPQHRVAKVNVAALDAGAGKVAAAMDTLQSIIRLDPRDPDARRRIDDLVVATLDNMLWLALAIGFGLAAFADHLNGG
jgi:tetratricopeptide (TPR) repeat protein